MKKLLLSMLVGLTSYAGVYASNDVILTSFSLENLEFAENSSIIKSDLLEINDSKLFFGLCTTHARVKGPDGEQSEFVMSVNTTSDEACRQKGKLYIAELEAMGYVIGSATHNWSE